MEEFQEFMNNIVQKHSQKLLSRGLQKVSGTLNHVKSFSAALSSFSQIDMAGLIVWGSLQIIIEVRVFALITSTLSPESSQG